MRVLLFALFCVVYPTTAQSVPYVDQVKVGLEQGHIAEMTLEAIDRVITVGAIQLRKAGYDLEADDLDAQWSVRSLTLLDASVDEMGDHDPVKWLYSVWEKLDKLVGRETMVLFHLDDLWIFSMSLRVITCHDAVDVDEYAKHFVGYDTNAVKLFKGGFAGALTYWLAMIACSAALEQPYSILCSPIASLAEYAVWKYVAPPLSPKVWKQVCE